jgi:chromosomal replication initiator protein
MDTIRCVGKQMIALALQEPIRPIALPSLSRISHRPTVQIQELVALSYGIHPRLMTSRSRTHAWPRQVAMYLTRELTKRSLPSIGEAFGNRHHTTVLHAIRTVERRMKTDPFDNADVLALRKVLEG